MSCFSIVVSHGLGGVREFRREKVYLFKLVKQKRSKHIFTLTVNGHEGRGISENDTQGFTTKKRQSCTSDLDSLPERCTVLIKPEIAT